jgi:DNA-binding LacI/PurR family transcriptional regulator
LRRAPGSDFRELLQHVSLDTSGVIYLAEPLSRAEAEGLRGYRRPLVLTKSALPHDIAVDAVGVPVVGVDNLGGARAAASLLLQLGHRRIGLIMGPLASRDSYERKAGYLEVLGNAGVAPRAEWVRDGLFTAETGRAGIEAFLAGRERPTAVCCANDEIAFGALDAIRSAGLRCPEDISLVGFDDGPWATICRPTLTTIRQPLSDLAERAVSLIVEGALHPSRAPQVVNGDFPAAIVIRESTRALASGE